MSRVNSVRAVILSVKRLHSSACDLIELRQQIRDSCVEGLQHARVVFIVFFTQKELVFYCFDLFLDASDLSEYCLNFAKHICVLMKAKVMQLQLRDQLCQIVDSLLATNEQLHATGVTNEIGLAMFVFPFRQLCSAHKTWNCRHPHSLYR